MNAISPPVQTVLDLFSTVLAEVRFADVDAQTLARAAEEANAAAIVVATAQAALDGARAALQERQDALLQHATRALAYARVYAEGDDALSAQLDAVALPRARRTGRPDGTALVLSPEPETPPRRGRPRKAALAEPISEPMLEAMTLAGE